jgi:hypothetical protein
VDVDNWSVGTMCSHLAGSPCVCTGLPIEQIGG